MTPRTHRDLLAPYVSIEITPVGPCRFAATFRCSDVEYTTLLTTEEPVGWSALAEHLSQLHRCPVTVRVPAADGTVAVHHFPAEGVVQPGGVSLNQGAKS